MRFFKYFIHSTLIVRLNLNPFVEENRVFPKFFYISPKPPYDNYRRTIGLIFPLIHIFIDLECETCDDKTRRVINIMKEQENELDN